MSQAKVEADPAGRNGYALIRVTGAAAAQPDPRFRLQGPDERAPYLGTQGWQPSDTLLKPRNAWIEGGDLVLEIGPEVVDLVENGTVGFSLPAVRLNLILIWPVLQPSRGSGQNVFHENRAKPVRQVEVITEKQVPKTPKPELQPDDDATVSMAATKAASAKAAAEEAAAAEAEALREQEALARRAREEAEKRKRDQQRKRKVPLLIAAGALVLVIILAGLWFFTQRGPTPFPPNQANQDTLNHGGGQPAPAPAASECDSEPFPAITQCEHDPAKLYQVGQARMTAGNAQDGVSLFGVAAKDGYGSAALALAKLYDPASFQQNAAIQQSDPGQAALYYRMAVNDGDQDAVAPRAALYQHLQQAASQGDLQAPNLLNDYWP